jgi:hypothetical protein
MREVLVLVLLNLGRESVKNHTLVAASLLLVSFFTQAADIDSVAKGDVYYIWQPDRPNVRVTVREVDRSGDRAKVAYPDGEVRWVSAGRLQTRSEATGTDIGVGAAVVGGALLFCALSPESCKSKPTQPAQGSSSGTAQVGGLLVRNNCRHPVKIAVRYRNLANEWIVDGWWNVDAKESTYLSDRSDRRLATDTATWYYYAETTNSSNLAWKGENTYALGSLQLPMVKLAAPKGDSEWTLLCD